MIAFEAFACFLILFFFSSRRRHTRSKRDWSSDVCSSDLGLGIARSLGRLGVPVYAVESKSLSPVFYSRYCRGHFGWNIEAAPANQTLEVLRNIAQRIGAHPLLIPTTDNSAMFVAAHAEALTQWYGF